MEIYGISITYVYPQIIWSVLNTFWGVKCWPFERNFDLTMLEVIILRTLSKDHLHDRITKDQLNHNSSSICSNFELHTNTFLSLNCKSGGAKEYYALGVFSNFFLQD